MNKVILAVAHGEDKTIIYRLQSDMAVGIIKMLILGTKWNDLSKAFNLVSVASTNDFNPSRAYKLEEKADLWIELGNTDSYNETLEVFDA